MASFRTFAAKRLFHGLVMYLVMALAYSLVFNGIAEKSLRAQADEEVARRMGMDEPWMVGLAGSLSRIGTLTVPEPVLAKLKTGVLLNSEERQAYNRVPEVGYRLLKNIPRLEGLADMVYYSQKNFNGSGFPHDDRKGAEIPLGARILRVCQDFTNTTPAVTLLNTNAAPPAPAK